MANALRDFLLGALGADGANRLTLEGVTARSLPDGSLDVAVARLQAEGLRLAAGPLALDVGRFTALEVVAQMRLHGGPALASLGAKSVDLAQVEVTGPVSLQAPAAPSAGPATPSPPPDPATWSLAPLATLDGTLRAHIQDAELIFDADVTVPIRGGQVDFGHASVEHVGPDSRMGVSRLGIYVDAPNGRTYVYQFAGTPVGGVEFEQRGALLGPWVTSRGKLRVQEFAEGMLRQGLGRVGAGLTPQTRALLERTSLGGDLQPGDGTIALPGVQATLVGRAQGRNAIRLESQAADRGLNAGIAALSLAQLALQQGVQRLTMATLQGTLTARLLVEGAQLRVVLALASATLQDVLLTRSPPGDTTPGSSPSSGGTSDRTSSSPRTPAGTPAP